MGNTDSQLHEETTFRDILEEARLSAVFQPIVNLSNATLYGYEALIRGPHGQLNQPLDFFAVAKAQGLQMEAERISREVVLESYAEKRCHDKLFINISPDCLVDDQCTLGFSPDNIYRLGLDPHNIVIELTESSPTFDFKLLRKAVDNYRNMGFEIAMDDLGEGFSSLRLWSEIQPDYVKIDKHFVQNIHSDALKLEFVKSIQQIAENSGARIIAEGIETELDLSIVKNLNIVYGQGYLFAQPQSDLLTNIGEDLKCLVTNSQVSAYPTGRVRALSNENLSKLVRYYPPIVRTTKNNQVYEMFGSNPNLYSIAVVDGTKPVGLISRYTMIDSFAKPYTRELFGQKSCEMFMDKSPLIVERDMGLQDLSDLITNMEPHHLSNGYIVTNAGEYIGLGSGHDLLREITQMQIKAARYANPLTLLPGNVPINEHVDRLLHQDAQFWACYCDLDNFKPFNDAYGFSRGDDLIKFVGNLLTSATSVGRDFVGHVGGDDFILIFQSTDWAARCTKILSELEAAMPNFYDDADAAKNGIEAFDRQGNKLFYPMGSMSIGVVCVDTVNFANHYEVFAAISRAKKQAKQTSGNSLFLERRTEKP